MGSNRRKVLKKKPVPESTGSTIYKGIERLITNKFEFS